MLLLPMDRSFDWRRPPVVTLLLVVFNLGCFFIWQAGEEEAMSDGMDYYVSSGLLEMEYPLFKRHMRKQGRLHEVPSLPQARQHPERLYFMMLDEGVFLKLLRNGRAIHPYDVGYESWRSHRERLEQMLDRVVFLRYGWKSADPDWPSLFAHMFLHADAFHLIGNMIFLVMVGFLVEGVLASWVFLICYALTGFGAAGLDTLMRADSMIPGIGASGAISGVMGMYAVLYWNRSVRVFYFLVVYFDAVRLPAIALLPLWIGNELYQMWANPESNVNFVAHLGGLASGAVVGWLARGTAAFDMQPLEERDQQDEFEQRMQAARQLCESQDFKAALPQLRALHREQPDNHQVLYHLFMAERLFPAGEAFHRVSNQILAMPMSDPARAAMVQEVLQSYLRLAKPEPKINPELACRLMSGFQRSGHPEAAHQLRQMVEGTSADCVEHNQLPTG